MGFLYFFLLDILYQHYLLFTGLFSFINQEYNFFNMFQFYQFLLKSDNNRNFNFNKNNFFLTE